LAKVGDLEKMQRLRLLYTLLQCMFLKARLGKTATVINP